MLVSDGRRSYVSGPPGPPGQNGRDGKDGAAGAAGLVRSINGRSAVDITLTPDDLGAVKALGSRAGFSTWAPPASTVHAVVNGYYAANDHGPARYVRGASTGPAAIQDAAGRWWVLDVSGEVDVRFFGASPAIADNSVAINQAVAAAQRVVISPGTYLLTSRLNLSGYTNLRLRGFGDASVLKLNIGMNDQFIYAKQSPGLVLEDFTADCTPQVGGCAVWIEQSLGVRVRRIKTLNAHDNGITLTQTGTDCANGCHDSEVSGCTVVATQASHAISLSGSNRCKVVGNTVQNVYHAGIQLYFCSDGVINDNIVDGGTLQSVGDGFGGIRLTNLSNRNSVTGNTVKNMNRGLYLSDGNDNVVVGNTFATLGFEAIFISGTNLDNGTRTCNRNLVAGNACRDTCLTGTGYSAICLENSANTAVPVQDNAVTGNNVTQVATTGNKPVSAVVDTTGFGNAVEGNFGNVPARGADLPYVEAYLNANVTNVTGDGSYYTFAFDGSAVVSGSAGQWDGSTFTAKARGIYSFSLEAVLIGSTASHTHGDLVITAGGSAPRGYVVPFNPTKLSDDSDYVAVNASEHLLLAAGQSVGFTVRVTNGTKVVGLLGSGGGNTVYTRLRAFQLRAL